MTRRQFALLRASTLLAGKMAMAQTKLGAGPEPTTLTVRFPDGSSALALGMGAWRLAQIRENARAMALSPDAQDLAKLDNAFPA